jgi:hypothetical protein
MPTSPRSLPLVSVVIAVCFALAVMTVAVSCSKGGIVKGPTTLQPPDSVFILAKDSKTASQIVLAFQSVGDASKYSLSVAEPAPEALKIPPPPEAKGATSQTYYLVSTYGDAPLRNMVLLQHYAVLANRFSLSTILGDDDSTTGSGMAGGPGGPTGSTNSNGRATGGKLGVAGVRQLQEVLRTINPALYTATYFNYQQVEQDVPSKPSQN